MNRRNFITDSLKAMAALAVVPTASRLAKDYNSTEIKQEPALSSNGSCGAHVHGIEGFWVVDDVYKGSFKFNLESKFKKGNDWTTKLIKDENWTTRLASGKAKCKRKVNKKCNQKRKP